MPKNTENSGNSYRILIQIEDHILRRQVEDMLGVSHDWEIENGYNAANFYDVIIRDAQEPLPTGGWYGNDDENDASAGCPVLFVQLPDTPVLENDCSDSEEWLLVSGNDYDSQLLTSEQFRQQIHAALEEHFVRCRWHLQVGQHVNLANTP